MLSQTVEAVGTLNAHERLGRSDISCYAGNREPNLEDLYDDPLLHAILERDGLRLATLKDIVSTAQKHLIAQ